MLSKRSIPGEEEAQVQETAGRDVFVPWVLSKPTAKGSPQLDGEAESPQVFNRYYHMFEAGELRGLVVQAAERMGLSVGEEVAGGEKEGVEIVQDGWERSNYFVELRRWKRVNGI